MRPTAGELIVILDEAAAKELPRMMSDQFIGVDVGGTKIAVAVLEGGELSEARIVPTNQASQEALVEQLARGDRGLGDRMDALASGSACRR